MSQKCRSVKILIKVIVVILILFFKLGFIHIAKGSYNNCIF